MFGKKQPQVLVVGAGPVGLFTALALRQRGVEVQIIDKDWRTGTRSYALALHAETLRWFEELGLLGEVLEHAQRIRTVGLYDGAVRKAAIRISDLAEDHSFLAVLPQHELEQILERKLAAAGIKVGWSREAADLRLHDDGVEVGLYKLSKDQVGYTVQHTDWVAAKAKPVRVPFVIGADGHASVVRRALAVDFPTVADAEEFAVFEFQTATDLGDEMRLTLGDDGTDLCWPLPGRTCRVSFQKAPDDPQWDTRQKDRDLFQLGEDLAPALSEQRLLELLEQRMPWFARSVKSIRWRMLVRFERRLASSFGRDRIWLVGDAAHLTGPVGVHSMNVGFREGLALAAAIDAVLHDSGSGALERYGKESRAEWRTLLGLEGGLLAGPDTDAWLAARLPRLLPCLPATGADLTRLVSQLGLSCATVRAGAR